MFTPDARANVLRIERKGRFSRIEASFRKDLVTKKVYTEFSLPTAAHPPPETIPTSPDLAAAPMQGAREAILPNACFLTDHHVYIRTSAWALKAAAKW